MTSYDRMEALCRYHKYIPEGLVRILYYPTHSLLDKLDKKLGVDTRGGVKHDPCCGPPHGQPWNYMGTRIRLHEEYIRQDVPPALDWQTDGYSFWLGREG